jgi:ArsR family transcriptional regulator
MDTNSITFAKAIADETRQAIMRHLCCDWLSVNNVVERLDGRVSQPTVSHHLKTLQEAGLVSVRQAGRQRFYTLNQARMTECCGNLVQVFAPDFAPDAPLIAPDVISDPQRAG